MAGSTSALELGRLFSLMEGVDPEGLFNAALRVAGADLGAGLPAQMPPQLQPGMDGLEDGGLKSNGSGDMGDASTDDDDDKGSMGGLGGPSVPPRTGAINDRKCTKVLPASSSAPKYKFVVPNEYVYKFMKHLVEQPFHMRDMSGKLWECVLIQRKNKEKYEYMIQGWRRFGESVGVQEGDTVTIEMVDDNIMQLTLEHTGGPANKKRTRKGGHGGGGGGGGGGTPLLPAAPPASVGGPSPSGGGPSFGVPDAQRVQLMQQAAAMQREVEAEASGLMNGQHHMMQQQGPGRSSQHQGVQQPSMSMQQQQQQGSQMGYGGGGGGSMGEPGPHGLLALIQQQQQQQQQHQLQQQREQQLGLMGGGGGGGGGVGEQHLTPRSLSAHLANGLTGPLGQLAGGSMNEAQLADLTAVINHLEKRQRVGDGPPGLGGGRPASGAGAIQLLSDVADMEKLMQENLGLREELRMMQGKIATLETGVLNIKSVLTRNTDPGLIAMTGVINLLNQMESSEFLPELGTIGRMTLTGLCSEVRRHLNGVLRMVWILRSLPDDVQQHNHGGGPTNSGGVP
ncbi:hypothetical protein D9Q98_000480 [Chlorella vulgaris]|uniref:TF-B3 domain-containing protein n=1 Tax=Chlorella vulgaris TaxID=3077 RepID=A0A9D4Z1W2_CHLVU|nr:hypothetical protein D9Q98_000480 [Chlorella vulgaris]